MDREDEFKNLGDENEPDEIDAVVGPDDDELEEEEEDLGLDADSE